jgi:hypothetical protein
MAKLFADALKRSGSKGCIADRLARSSSFILRSTNEHIAGRLFRAAHF